MREEKGHAEAMGEGEEATAGGAEAEAVMVEEEVEGEATEEEGATAEVEDMATGAATAAMTGIGVLCRSKRDRKST